MNNKTDSSHKLHGAMKDKANSETWAMNTGDRGLIRNPLDDVPYFFESKEEAENQIRIYGFEAEAVKIEPREAE